MMTNCTGHYRNLSAVQVCYFNAEKNLPIAIARISVDNRYDHHRLMITFSLLFVANYQNHRVLGDLVLLCAGLHLCTIGHTL